MDNDKTIWWVIGFIAVTVIGFLVIPPLIKKYGNKIYRSSLKKEVIDFDNMGPEIVKKDKGEEE